MRVHDLQNKPEFNNCLGTVKDAADGGRFFVVLDGEAGRELLPSVEGMSVKEMREELATLGSSAEGCWERSEIEEKLRQVRQAKGGHGPAAAAGAPAPAVAGMEQFMASMTASFNTMGDSFGNMVCARLSFPRAPCSVMRKCRTK